MCRFFFFSSRRRHTRCSRDWSSDVCSSDIGLEPKREGEFVLADGTTICRPVSECQLALLQGEGHTPVVLGQPGDAEALLGVVTLEILGLVFDPFRRTLQPMRALLV